MPNLLARKESSYKVPSIARAKGNALALQGQEIGNELAQKKLGTFDEDRQNQKTMRDLQTEATAISTALKSGNTKQASEIYKSLGGRSNSGISIAGPNVTIDYGDSTFTGPGESVSELMENIGKDPAWAVNPKTKAWAAAKGISFTDSKKSLSKAKATGKGGVTKEKALKRISGIQKAKATLEKTDMITQLLVKENPELAPMLGTKLDPEKKAELMAAWDNELDYLEEFSGTSRKKEMSKPGLTEFTFIPGKGIVEVTKEPANEN